MSLAGRVLKLAATVWCFSGTNLTWLDRAPEILTESGHRARAPYPLNPQEQQLLLSELDSDAVQTATFAINTGARDGELCQLQWKWERRVRVHDLRHTFGRRLRAAGVSLEDRRDLLGHKGPEITTLYSAAEIGRLVEAANQILGSHETSTPSVRQVIEG